MSSAARRNASETLVVLLTNVAFDAVFQNWVASACLRKNSLGRAKPAVMGSVKAAKFLPASAGYCFFMRPTYLSCQDLRAGWWPTTEAAISIHGSLWRNFISSQDASFFLPALAISQASRVWPVSRWAGPFGNSATSQASTASG